MDYDPNSSELIDARIRALRNLVIAILQRDPSLIAEIEAALEAPQKMPVPEWRRLEVLAMQGILTRAKFPEGPPEGASED